MLDRKVVLGFMVLYIYFVIQSEVPCIIFLITYLLCTGFAILYVILERDTYTNSDRTLITLFWWFYMFKFIIREGK